MELFAKRASIRRFTEEDVSPEMVNQLLNAAVQAPSAGNLQPWHFYVVRKTSVKEALYENAYRQSFIRQAPVVIVVCAEPSRSAVKYETRGETLYCIQDTAAAIENILLCATALGLGGCWVGAFDEDAVREALALPAGRRPVALLPIGHPAATGTKPKRREIGDVVTYIED